MSRNKAKLFLPALLAVLVLAGCHVRFGPATNKAGGPNPGGINQGGSSDPAEEAAIQVVKKHKGSVVQDPTRPNNRVVQVGVWFNTFTDADLKALASLTKVERMNLAGTKITGTGFKDLTGLKNLTELNVAQTPFNDDGLKAIAALTQLKILWLSGTKITDAGLRQLAPLTKLEELHVAGNLLGDTAAVHIASTLKQLKKVYFDNSSVGDVGVMELAKLPNLQVLTINGTRVTDTGLAALAGVPALEELQLSFDITDKSAALIARCKNLRVLRLFNTKITDRGLQALGSLAQLKDLDLHGSHGVTNKGVADFIKAHPGCSVKK